MSWVVFTVIMGVGLGYLIGFAALFVLLVGIAGELAKTVELDV